MNDLENKYTFMVELLRSDRPELKDPEVLTKQTIVEIEKLPFARASSRSLRIVSWISTASSVALLCLFLYQFPMPKTSHESRQDLPVLLATDIKVEKDVSVDQFMKMICELNERPRSFYIDRINKLYNHKSEKL